MDPIEEAMNSVSPLEGFNNMDEFYNRLVAERVWGTDPLLHVFWNTYEQINVGCNCNRKKRIENAIMQYKKLAELHESTQVFLKASFNTKKITLSHEGEVFIEM